MKAAGWLGLIAVLLAATAISENMGWLTSTMLAGWTPTAIGVGAGLAAIAAIIVAAKES